MSLAAFLPLRSPHPHYRSPPDAFSPRVNFSPRPALAPMSRIRIETISRRTTDLPRDPTDWVDKDLLSYVRYNYSPIEAVSLSEVIERDRLTPTALWYLQAEPEQLLAIAEEESLRDTLLGLAHSLKPAVSPTSPRIRHVRRLSEDLERPPPPPPPPPPSPPTPEEPELEEDDDVAESVVSDWALDEDLDGNDGMTPIVDDIGDLTGSAAQPEPPLEGLGLHTGEPHLDNTTPPQSRTLPTDADDLINLEDGAQPSVPQQEATDPHTTLTDTDAADDPPVEEPAPSQDASANAHVPDAAEEKLPAATHRADPSPPSDEPSASRGAGASMPADPFDFGSPIEDDDLGNPWADSEDTSEGNPMPPPPPADPARTATPTSDYHDANSIHSEEGERPEATPTEQESEPSPVHAQEQGGAATPKDEEQPSTETLPPTETPVPTGTTGPEHPTSDHDAPPSEEVQQEKQQAPTIEPPPATDPVQTAATDADPVQTAPPPTDPVQTSPPSVTDPAQPPSIPHSILTRVEETAPTQEEHVSPAAAPQRDETTHVNSSDSKDTQAEEPPVQLTTATSGFSPSAQSQETAEADGGESTHLDGEDKQVGEETVQQVDEETVGKAAERENAATVPEPTTTEPVETTDPLEAAKDMLDNSPAPEESSEGDVSGVQANEQSSTPEETQAVQPEAEVTSHATQEEGRPEKSSAPSETPVTESVPSPPPLAHTTTDPTPAVTAMDPPPSPTVRLASGVEAQLIDPDAESTERAPSASPGDTPPNGSSSPSESRQGSPPAEEAEKPAEPARASITASTSPLDPTERKAPAPPRLNMAFGSLSEGSRSAKPSANLPWQHPPAFGSALSPAAKGVTWGSAQSTLPKSAGPWGKMFSSMTSIFNQQSEPSTRESSPERESPATRTPIPPPARQPPAARPSPWGKKNWSAVAATPTSSQQPLKSRPPAPAEPFVNVSPVQAPPPTDTNADVKAGRPTSVAVSDSSPAKKSATQATDPRAEELTEGMSDSVLVDSGTPSAGNGEPARETEGSQNVVPNQGDLPDAGSPRGEDQNKDAEDEDVVNITADDIAGAEKDAESESRRQEGAIGGGDDDDDDDAPLDRRLARVRQVTGDSISSAVTSDTENQGDEDQPGRRTGLRPKLQTSGLPSEPDGVGSPAVESPVVGTPTSKAKKRKNKKKKGGQ